MTDQVDQKISQLPVASSLDGTEQVPIVQGGVNKRTSASNLTATGVGITQAAGDERYVQKSQINAPDGVAGLNGTSFLTEAQLPLPPVTLTTLFANKLV